MLYPYKMKGDNVKHEETYRSINVLEGGIALLLNADIVFDRIPEEMHARITGARSSELTLRRPELYEGAGEVFLSGHLYLVLADRLPPRGHAERGCVIVCIGDSERVSWYRSRCCVISLPDAYDFYRSFNIIQGIFDRFDAWEDTLSDAAAAGDIQGILDASAEVFHNPIYAIDSDFHVLGVSVPEGAQEVSEELIPSDNGSLGIAAIDQFLENHTISTEVREPLVINLLDQTTLNCNLFDEDDVYIGCATVHYISGPYHASDGQLVSHMGKALTKAMQELSEIEPDAHGVVRRALVNLLEGYPLDAIERDALKEGSGEGLFVCMRLKLASRSARVPLGYVRNSVEGAFPQSVVIEYHHNSVAAFVDFGSSRAGDYLQELRSKVEPFTHSMGMNVGVSDPFVDLMESRLRFLQANTALDIGLSRNPGVHVYMFQDYALYEMIEGALRDMPIELFSPTGLSTLIAHDATSATSYIETLRTYLNNNANIAKTSRDLYIHRSTLVERLERIKRELGDDFDDPDGQLRLRIILKALEMRKERARGAKENGQPA